jgi:hypothetical protein
MGKPKVVRNEKGEIVKLIATGKGGLQGYLNHICETDTKLFVYLLARVLPMQINTRIEAEVRQYNSTDEIIEEMKKERLHEQQLPPRLRLIKNADNGPDDAACHDE